MPKIKETTLNFDVSTGLKRVLGRELITDDEVAIFELVKNSFDAKAKTVYLYFGDESVVVADNGCGMSSDDLRNKWLFVAYSSKRSGSQNNFRQITADRGHYAGSKGIGRFSSDRLGEKLVLQSRPKGDKSRIVHRLTVDWQRFEKNDKEHFEKVPVTYSATSAFQLPSELRKFTASLKQGTVIEISSLRRNWDRPRLLALKSSLAKLINPFGDATDRFSIHIIAPAEAARDKDAKKRAAESGEKPLAKDIVNGRVGNFIFSALQEKTTFIRVLITNGHINTSLTDRGELIYKIREPNPYKHLDKSGFRCEMYYLNQSAKLTFARRVGLPSVRFGSVFLFRNGFRVYPIGNDGDDWFGFDRRKQQGYNRFLGTREVIGRVDVYASHDEFQEASSRNQGLIETPAVRQLHKAVMDHCLKRLEKYVVPVSWVDKGDANTEDLSRLLTDPGRARVSAAVASLVDNDEIELLDYSKQLINLINERSSEFETSLVSLRSIAEKTGDKTLLSKLRVAEKRFDELRKSEAEARQIADRERAAAEAASQRAQAAESAADEARSEAETERRRAHFLESAVTLDTSTILNLHHQVTIYAVDIAQQIENLLAQTAGDKTVSRETLLKAMEQVAFLNRKVLAVTRFAAKANFKLDSEKIETDLPAFLTDYIEQIARNSGSARLRIQVENTHPGLKLRFNPIDASIIVDNLISNSRKAKASLIKFRLAPLDKNGLMIHVSDNGRGIAAGTNKDRVFEMGYTTTHGSGLGLYHVRQVLGEMGGSIELEDAPPWERDLFLDQADRREEIQLRLDFNVLWVDDQPDRVDAQITGIAKQMENEGFQFIPKQCTTIDQVGKLISDHVFTDEIDLILVDWDLGGGMHGQDAIAAIRQAVPYKDVVFYSAQNPANELRRLAFENGLEGVYCASREDLVDEVLGVFESLVKKVLDIDHTRGIVMGATSDIDHMVNECLVTIHDKLDEPGKEAMIKEGLRRIDDKIKDLTKKAAKLQQAPTMATLLEAHMIFTAQDRLRMLSRMLENERFKAHVESRTAVRTYIEKVVPGRNDLGHLVLVPEGKPQTVTNIRRQGN